MLNRLFVIAAFSLCLKGYAQSEKSQLPLIEVSGTAELEVIPNEVFLSITIKEFVTDKKVKHIDAIEKDFFNVLEKLKINQQQVTLESVWGNFDYDYKENKRGEFLNAKTYLIKLNNLMLYNNLVIELNKKGIEQIYIAKSSHNQIEKFKQQVKVDAVKNALEKANAMLYSLNKKAGEVLLVRERDNNVYYPVTHAQDYVMKSAVAEAAQTQMQAEDISMQKIKLSYSVEVHFVIVNL